MLATNHNAKCNLNDGLHAFRGYFNVFSGVITPSDLDGSIPPINWIVKNFLPKESLVILYGEPGTMKTYMAIDLAMCVATGKPWLGLETTQTSVIMIDEESGKNRIIKRMLASMNGHEVSIGQTVPFYVTLPSGVDLGDRHWELIIIDAIQKSGSELVILDALADVMPGADENSVRETQPIFNSLRSIVCKTGVTLVVIHHTNKGGGYRGSTAIKAAVDQMICVKSTKGTKTMNLMIEKARDFDEHSIKAQVVFEHKGDCLEKFYLCPSSASEQVDRANKASKRLSDIREKVILFVAKHPNRTTSTIIKGCGEDIQKGSKEYEKIRQVIQVLLRKPHPLLMRTNSGGFRVEAKYSLSALGVEFAKERAYEVVEEDFHELDFGELEEDLS